MVKTWACWIAAKSLGNSLARNPIFLLSSCSESVWHLLSHSGEKQKKSFPAPVCGAGLISVSVTPALCFERLPCPQGHWDASSTETMVWGQWVVVKGEEEIASFGRWQACWLSILFSAHSCNWYSKKSPQMSPPGTASQSIHSSPLHTEDRWCWEKVFYNVVFPIIPMSGCLLQSVQKRLSGAELLGMSATCGRDGHPFAAGPVG